MRHKGWFGSKTPRTYQTTPYKPRQPQEHSFTDRQELIHGFDQAALREVALIGVGGLGSWPALGLTQAGVRKILLCDRDRLEASNLPRTCYRPTAVGCYKVEALGEELARFGAGETTIVAFPFHFEDMVALYGKDVFSTSQVAVIGVDSEESRVAASRHFRALQIPAIFSGVSLEGKTGFVLIERPGGPCYGCVYPQVVKAIAEETLHNPCPRTPAMSPILHALSGLILEAIFATLMPKLYHGWNYWYLAIDASIPSGGAMLAASDTCPLCGDASGQGAEGQ